MNHRLRESNVAWIGSVPDTWNIVPANGLFTERKQRNEPEDVHLTPSQKYGVLPQAEYMQITGSKVVLNLTGADNMRHVEPGDFISHLRSFQGGLEYSEIQGKVSAAYTVITRRTEISGAYYKYLFKSAQYVQALQTTTDQLRDGQSIRMSQFKQIPLPQPPLDEQQAIADYLDRETAQIDAFIAKNEELIATLKERKKSVTANAVTHGIDETAKLKDSGVPWLGEVPADWQVVRVKFAVDSQPGYAFSSSEFVEDTSATRLLRGINVGVQEIDWDEVVSIPIAPANISQTYTLHQGDLVMGMDRPLIRDGLRIAPVDRESSGTLLVQRVLRLRGVAVLNEYLNYSMAWGGFAMYIEPDFTGVSVPHMSEQQVGNYVIALPDLSTQQQIIAYLREQNSRMDTAIDTAGKAIELAKERRAALISAAVTGKIDVSREASAV